MTTVRRCVAALITLLIAHKSAAQAGRGSFEPLTDAGVEARIRSELFPRLAQTTAGAGTRATFEKAFRGESDAAAELLRLARSQDEETAVWASQVAGRYPTQDVIAGLGDIFTSDTRLLVRTGALAGLRRTGHASAASLSIQALSDPSGQVQLLGIIMVQTLGDPSQSAALLAYLDAPHRQPPAVEVLEALGKLGDPPGSTAVRDRLAKEANKKTNAWETRSEAAKGLRKMGQGQLAQLVLDRFDAEETYELLVRYQAAARKAASIVGVTVRSQAELDALSPSINVPAANKVDAWGRTLRTVFKSLGTFSVVSDGPDRTPGTPDDISTNEAFSTYDKRMFAALFQ